jgi:hypothetical protein
LVPLYRTKVFADDTTRKIIDVTLGELLTLQQWISDPISNTKWEARRQEWSDGRIVPEA